MCSAVHYSEINTVWVQRFSSSGGPLIAQGQTTWSLSQTPPATILLTNHLNSLPNPSSHFPLTKPPEVSPKPLLTISSQRTIQSLALAHTPIFTKETTQCLSQNHTQMVYLRNHPMSLPNPSFQFSFNKPTEVLPPPLPLSSSQTTWSLSTQPHSHFHLNKPPKVLP